MRRGIGGENPGSGYGAVEKAVRRTRNTSYIWVMRRVGVGLGGGGGERR